MVHAMRTFDPSCILSSIPGMGEHITFKANGRTAPGYLARPKGSGPGVVVIQEWWGLSKERACDVSTCARPR